MRRNAAAAAAVLAITAFSMTVYPGRSYLRSDTQIYIPVMQWLDNPRLYADDLLPAGAHVSLTIYDEAARAVKRATGGYESALVLQQAIYRAAGILGALLIATACGLSLPAAAAVAFLTSLGATIIGPAVLTVEYEPVPRGFAVGLIMLAIGLLAHRRYWPAGAAAALAFLYHAPAVWPFWLLVPVLPRRRELLLSLAAAIAILIPLAIPQTGLAERQRFFSLLSPEHAELQRLRAGYNWISLWFGRYGWFYLTAWTVGLAAYWRVRAALPETLRTLFLGLPAIGILTMPASYLLLEKIGWALLPQLQPMRALLFTVLIALMLAAIAAFRTRSWPERIVWLALVAYTPFLHGGQAPAPVETPALTQLSEWARASTPADAVFLFPDEGKGLAPGVFRARSERAVYVDWKAGGQVNYFPEYSHRWWRRWNEAMVPPFDESRAAALRALGIDYVVVSKSRLAGEPVWTNGVYAVYRLR
jgi:hypothetical protein